MIENKYRFFQLLQIVNKVFAIILALGGVIGGLFTGSGFLIAALCIGMGLFLLATTEIIDVLMAIEENTRSR